MPFSKSFPRQSKMGVHWEEISLSDAEEKEAEAQARAENVRLMNECILDAKTVAKESGLKDYQTDIIHIAISLFEKRSSHEIYWKENKAKEKFERQK